ncbi:NAD(P)/FAD-dependent oxidoreductase [Candidatus Woesearchaeota archaeon]|nr:NAD(P)/FAD-dependent oxidoreductase [Candidatus Woesearchaeota archaeon]
MITVVGGGPVGSFSAYNLTKKGQKVRIFEEHKKIGVPVQCTGIVTKQIDDIVKLKKNVILNKVTKAKIIAPNNKSVTLAVKDYVIDRTLFDEQLSDMAVDAGAKLFTNTRFLDYTKRVKVKQGTKTKYFSTDWLVGADGPNSKVRLLITTKRPKVLVGKQAIIKGSFEKNTFQVYLDVPNFFGWVVPIDSTTARVGLATTTNVAKHFENFIKGKGKIQELQAGTIPIFNPLLKTQKNNILIVGDAAGQIKATTGGGIIPGLKASKIAAKSIIKKSDYNLSCKAKLGVELTTHLMIRKTLNKFSAKDYNELITLTNQQKIRNVFAQASRDNFSLTALKLMFQEPKYLKYLTKLF